MNNWSVTLVAFLMDDCGYKRCVHRQIISIDNVFVLKVNCVDAFRWTVQAYSTVQKPTLTVVGGRD